MGYDIITGRNQADKKIFGDKERTDLLKSLLNDILQLEGTKKIKTVIFKKSGGYMFFKTYTL